MRRITNFLIYKNTSVSHTLTHKMHVVKNSKILLDECQHSEYLRCLQKQQLNNNDCKRKTFNSFLVNQRKSSSNEQFKIKTTN